MDNKEFCVWFVVGVVCAWCCCFTWWASEGQFEAEKGAAQISMRRRRRRRRRRRKERKRYKWITALVLPLFS